MPFTSRFIAFFSALLFCCCLSYPSVIFACNYPISPGDFSLYENVTICESAQWMRIVNISKTYDSEGKPEKADVSLRYIKPAVGKPVMRDMRVVLEYKEDEKASALFEGDARGLLVLFFIHENSRIQNLTLWEPREGLMYSDMLDKQHPIIIIPTQNDVQAALYEERVNELVKTLSIENEQERGDKQAGWLAENLAYPDLKDESLLDLVAMTRQLSINFYRQLNYRQSKQEYIDSLLAATEVIRQMPPQFSPEQIAILEKTLTSIHDTIGAFLPLHYKSTLFELLLQGGDKKLLTYEMLKFPEESRKIYLYETAADYLGRLYDDEKLIGISWDIGQIVSKPISAEDELEFDRLKAAFKKRVSQLSGE